MQHQLGTLGLPGGHSISKRFALVDDLNSLNTCSLKPLHVQFDSNRENSVYPAECFSTFYNSRR